MFKVDTTDHKKCEGDVALLKDDIKVRLGSWYMMRHGVDTIGNQQEMVTLIQAYWVSLVDWNRK